MAPFSSGKRQKKKIQFDSKRIRALTEAREAIIEQITPKRNKKQC